MAAPPGGPPTTAGRLPTTQDTGPVTAAPGVGGPPPLSRSSACATHIQPEGLRPLAHRLVAAAARTAVGRLVLEDVVSPRRIPVLVEHHRGSRAAWRESLASSAGSPAHGSQPPGEARASARIKEKLNKQRCSWHQGKAHQATVRYHLMPLGQWWPKQQKITRISKDLEKLALLCTAGGDVKGCSHCGKQ